MNLVNKIKGVVLGTALGLTAVTCQAQNANLVNGLISYYDFNEGSGNVARDAFRLQNLPVSNSWADGKANSAYNPNRHFYDIGLNLSGQSGASINFWLRRTGVWGTYENIIQTGNTDGNFYIDTADISGRKTVFSYYSGAASDFNLNFPTDGIWHMLTLTLENGSEKGYLDSIQQFSSSVNFSFSANNITLFGGAGNGSPGDNAMNVDELGIWNRVLTSDEVSSLYDNGVGLIYTGRHGGIGIESLGDFVVATEPSTLGLTALGGATFLAMRRKRKKSIAL